MGGDSAPEEVVRGAVNSVKEQDDLTVLLAGDKEEINELLASMDYDQDRIRVVHAPQEIEMDEDAAESIRQKEESSINVAVETVSRGEADAILSAGNTGATVSAASLKIGLLGGIDRPGIAIPLPNLEGHTLLVDVGANIYCKPEHLLQYGVMASVYREEIDGVDNPRVGLLNIGEEREKGTDLLKNTFPLFEDSTLNFAGNCEGQAIFSGELDVVVTEGFLGNVLLKTLEGFSASIIDLFREEFLAGNTGKQTGKKGKFVNKLIGQLKKRLDYTEQGGAPLLGLNGVCIICHGRSGRKSIRNAIQVASQFYRMQINDRIVQEIEQV